jgi:bifunctional non-homologous end joining protein LigD
MGLEGVVSKRRDQPYRAGRSDEWIKTKCVAREELVIGGFTLSTAMKRGIGALLVGYFEGDKLTYAGRVGTGFSAQALEDIREKLEAIKQAESPFAHVPPKEKGPSVRWVAPQLVAQIEFTGWTEGGILRHPSFQGFREDKPARSVTRPPSLTLPSSANSPQSAKHASAEHATMSRAKPAARGRAPHKPKKTSSGARKKSRSSADAADVSANLTHPDRVLYPDSGLTKLGLATYYSQVAPWILPHLAGRPLSLVRCPGGQGTKCFFQKHATPEMSSALRRVDVEEKAGTEPYVMVENLEGLLALVQMAVLEIHPWGSRSDRLEQPDRLIFDLDPGERVAWPRVVEGALAVRKLLKSRGLESFVKTTGGKGLHVVVPLAPRRTEWDEAKAFCREIAEELSSREPDQYLANMSKAARTNKIFVDYLRNDRGATAVAPYSTRARPGAPVSTPIAWKELSPALRSDHFNAGNLPGRLESLKKDPWEGLFDLKQTIRS